MMGMSGKQQWKWRRFSRLLNIVALIALIVGVVAPAGASAALPVGRAAGEAAFVRPASVDATNLVTNGDFASGLSGWSYTGSVYVNPGASEYMLVFNGGNNPTGDKIWQQVSTEAGKPYALTYALMWYTGGYPSPGFASQTLVEAIDVGTGQVLASATSVPPYPWPEGFTLSFVAQGATTIRFTDTSAGTVGQDLYMDNVAVTLANQAPTAADDSYTASYQTALTVDAPGVLANDTDPDSDPLTAVKVTDPAHGSVTLNADGSFTYTPATGYTGADSFTYHANDGTADSNDATVNITVSAPPCATQPANLVSWWRGEGDAQDALGGNHGATQNGATYAAGEVGQAFSFDGVNQHVSVPSDASIEMRNNLTVMAWFKVNSLADGAHAKLFTKRAGLTYGYGPFEIDLSSDAGNILVQSQYSTDGATWGFTPALQTITAGGWHHVAFVVDGSNLHTFYLDGQPQGSAQLPAPLMAHEGTRLLFGVENGGSFPLNGLLDEAQIASRALSAAEIQGIYDAGSSGVCAPTNTAPTAANDSYDTSFETELVVPAAGVLTNDTDPDSDLLTAVKVTDPAHGTVVLNADGSFNYRATTGYAGPDSFTYRANDGSHNSNVATVSISVLPSVGDAGLLGYWKFDDGSGTAALDASDYKRNGTVSGGATWSTTVAPITYYSNPGAISMTGSTGLVTIPNSDINKLTNNFSVMAWVNPNSVSVYQRVIASARTKSANGWSFGLFNKSLLFTTYGKKDYYSVSAGMSTGKWYHIAAVMDGSNGVTFYLDGISLGTVTGTAPATADTDDALQIGATTTSGAATLTEAFNGLIDDVQVYNRALSAAEIANMAGVSPCSETVFRARVMLAEASSSKVLSLDGACTYTLSTVGDAWNGGNGAYLSYVTTIDGNGATIERSATAPQMRIMTLGATNATINNLAIRGGNVLAGGGGIYAWSNLTLNNVRFENNTTNHPAGATYVNVGGALYAAANLTVDRSSFHGNQTDGYGGAVYVKGATATIKNSVFADNISAFPGAAINSAGTTTVTLLNNTFGDQYKNPNEALLVNGPATVKNNIFQNFSVGITASGTSAAVTEDYNLFAGVDIPTQALSGGALTAGGHDRTGASARFANPAGRDYRLQSNSPAIDFGTDAGVPTDAAGNPRPATSGTPVDIGAYEYQGVGVPSISITKVGPPYAAASGQSQFVITVINEGADTLNDLRVVDPLPAGATYVAGSASNGGALSGGSLVWDLAPLAPNAKARVWYQVTAGQSLVSSGYTVSSISNPAITASGPTFTTTYDPNYTSLGFSPFPDGYSWANWGTPVFDTDITVDDMVSIYSPAVCKTQNPCVLTAAAEAQRQTLSVTSSGGHCGGMAMSSLYVYDRPDVEPSLYQPGAINTYDLTWANARHNVVYFHSTQTASPADTSGLSGYNIATGAANVVNALLANFANPNADNRYTLWFFKPDWSSGHAVVPYAVRKVDNDHYWIYIYDVNYPNNYDRYFEITMSANSWVYNMAAANPSVPPSPWAGDNTQPTTIALKSLRWAERFPKQCATACAPNTFSKLGPANAATGVATNPTLSWEAAESATEYQYCYDTTNDNSCAGFYSAGTATSKTLSGLAPNTTYYWQARAKNSYGYTNANGAFSAFWSFTTGASSAPAAPALAAPSRSQAAPSPTYEFQLEGEGYLMITRSDGKRAGVDPANGHFIAEIPGAEQVLNPNGLLNTPNPISIPHEAGMTYTLRISDRPNAYGNASATADVNISGAGYMTRLTGLKIDSPADPTSGAGANDVLGVTFDPEKNTVSFKSSSLDSDTPSLGMAISQQGMPDFTFEISGASMPPGKEISVALDPETGKLTVTNDNPASDSYTYSVERINLDGSKTSYTGTANDGAGQGASFDLGPGWTGGAPAVETVNTALKLETTTPEFCIGDGATIDLNMSNVLGLYGYQIDMTYDPNKVSATGAFDNGWFDTSSNALIPGGYNATCAGGLCRFGATRMAPATPLTGSGRLATLNLTGVAGGTFTLTITASLLSDIDGMPITHEVVNLPLTVCGLSTISGKISMQGRATPINVGKVTLIDPTGTYGPYEVDFSATDGAWTISGVRAAGDGTVYKLRANHGLYLFNEKNITVQRSTGYADQNTRLWGGDANNDEQVSIGDLSCIGGAFGSWAQCGTDGASDINADGITNILDLSIAGGNYNKASPQGW